MASLFFVVLVPIGRVRVYQHLGGYTLRDTANLPIQYASNQWPLHVSPCYRHASWFYFLTDFDFGKSFQPRNKIMSYVNAKTSPSALVTTRCLKTLNSQSRRAIRYATWPQVVTWQNRLYCAAWLAWIRSMVAKSGLMVRRLLTKCRNSVASAWCFQSYALFPNMTGFEQHCVWPQDEKACCWRDQREVAKVIGLVDLTGKEVLPASAIRRSASACEAGKSLGG